MESVTKQMYFNAVYNPQNDMGLAFLSMDHIDDQGNFKGYECYQKDIAKNFDSQGNFKSYSNYQEDNAKTQVKDQKRKSNELNDGIFSQTRSKKSKI